MQLITDGYRNLNEQLHGDNKNYGTSGSKYVKDVMRLCHQIESQDVLDYGCGKSTLAHNLPFKIQQYDPCVEKYKALPVSADIVVCTDVLEHIEPELIDNVLSHIRDMTRKTAYLVANTNPAVKVLADGRNAHILLRSPKWWCDKMFEYFDPITFMDNAGNVVFIVKAKGYKADEQKKQTAPQPIPHPERSGEIAAPSSPKPDQFQQPAHGFKPRPATDFLIGF